MSLFIRHVQALKERRSNFTFVSGFIRMMKHKYVMTAMFLQLPRVADSFCPHYCSLLVQTELSVSSVEYLQDFFETSECKSVHCVT